MVQKKKVNIEEFVGPDTPGFAYSVRCEDGATYKVNAAFNQKPQQVYTLVVHLDEGEPYEQIVRLAFLSEEDRENYIERCVIQRIALQLESN